MPVIEFDFGNDIYYAKKYINLYLKDKQEIFSFEYTDGDLYFKNTTIKRPIEKIGTQQVGEGFYDLETPYGYGGYLTNSDDQEFLEQALVNYKQKCKEQNIIAEFIRFNPFNLFPAKNGNLLDFCLNDRKTVAVELHKPYEDIKNSYKSNVRRNLNKSNRLGLTALQLEKTPEILALYKSMYYSTMDKNNADSFYYFDEDYFKNLFNIDTCKLYGVKLENKVINLITIFESGDFLYYHLVANDSEYYTYQPNTMALDKVIQDYSCIKPKYLYLGGGNSGSEDDNLFKYKSRFSDFTKDFYIGGNVFNQEKYNEYVTLWKEGNNSDKKLFLQYRA